MQKEEKLFDDWNKDKKFLEKYKNKDKIVNIGEIWICKIGINLGTEISKNGDFTRPVLVVRNFLGGDLIGIIPFSTKYKDNYKKFLYKLENYNLYGLEKESYLILNQFKIISLKRLTRLLNSTKSGKNIVPNIEIQNILEKLFKIIKKEPLNL